MNVIVVAVDQSEGAKAALRFALEEAKLRQASVRAVHTFYPAVGAHLSEVRDAAEQALAATLRELLPDTDSVEVEQRLVEGRPGAVLVNESRDADLLVVGSRGHGGFADLLLGSVSRQVSHHAECPVVIVRPHQGGE